MFCYDKGFWAQLTYIEVHQIGEIFRARYIIISELLLIISETIHYENSQHHWIDVLIHKINFLACRLAKINF